MNNLKAALVNNHYMQEYNNDSIRELERNSIRAFMERNRHYLKGRVLDFGSGKQPYRDLVDGEYVPYEKGDPPIEPCAYDTIMCNQVIQYNEPEEMGMGFYGALRDNGYLVMTGPTNWAEVEETDLQRFTRAGISYLLRRCGFNILSLESRAGINLNGFELSLGYGVVGQRS